MSSAALYCPRPPIPWPSLPPADPAAIWDNVLISVTSATGQLFIYFTIRKFGPVAFTIIMTTRQVGRTARGVAGARHEALPAAWRECPRRPCIAPPPMRAHHARPAPAPIPRRSSRWCSRLSALGTRSAPPAPSAPSSSSRRSSTVSGVAAAVANRAAASAGGGSQGVLHVLDATCTRRYMYSTLHVLDATCTRRCMYSTLHVQ